MATLVSRIGDLAGAVRDKFNQIMPRLVPTGGTTGQALVKASDSDNSVQWSTVSGGGGTSYTLATDTAPTLNADLATNSKQIIGVIPTSSGIQYIKTVPASSSVAGSSLYLTARNVGDTANIASIQLRNISGSGTNFYQAGTHTFSDSSGSAIVTMPGTTGTTGQALCSAGNASSKMVWNALPPVYTPGYTTTAFYSTPGPRGTITLAPDMLYLIPFSTSMAFNFYTFALEVLTASSGGLAKFGVYTMVQTSSGSRTFTRVVNSGTTALSLASTGVQAANLSAASSQGANRYYLAVQANAAATVTALTAGNGLFSDSLGDSIGGFGTGSAGFTYSSGTYSAGLPTGFTTTATATQNPLIGIKTFN